MNTAHLGAQKGVVMAIDLPSLADCDPDEKTDQDMLRPCTGCGLRVDYHEMRVDSGGAYCRDCRPHTGEELEVLERLGIEPRAIADANAGGA